MKTVRANWRTAILVCRKCTKKVCGGFGAKGSTSLAKALRADMGPGKGRKASAGIVEVDCLKICPKRGVVVVDTARPREWQVVAPGTPIEELRERFGLAEQTY